MSDDSEDDDSVWDESRRLKDIAADAPDEEDDDDTHHRARHVYFGESFATYSQPVVRLYAGYFTTCALMATSEVKCFGANHYGQLGIASAATVWGRSSVQMGRHLPSVNLGTGTWVKSVSSRYGTSCAITQYGVVKCWGINLNGALGYGDTVNRGGSEAQMGENLPAVEL